MVALQRVLLLPWLLTNDGKMLECYLKVGVFAAQLLLQVLGRV